MLIEPATIAQIARRKDGKMIEIADDVGNVAKDLREIDPNLYLRYSEGGQYFVVYYHPEGDPDPENGHLVTTAQELDQRIVDQVRKISDEAYNYADELDKAEVAKNAARDHEFEQTVGEVGERLAHALRKDRNVKNRIVIPKEINA